MLYFCVVKRVCFSFSIFEEKRLIAIFDRPPGDEKNNFNRPNKFLFDRVDRANGISKAIYINIHINIYIFDDN